MFYFCDPFHSAYCGEGRGGVKGDEQNRVAICVDAGTNPG